MGISSLIYLDATSQIAEPKNNVQNRIDSFYEFPTKNVNKTAVGLGATEASENEHILCLGNHKKPPTWDEVIESCLEHKIYEQRTTDMKRHGVMYSQRTDSDSSNGNFFKIFFSTRGKSLLESWGNTCIPN